LSTLLVDSSMKSWQIYDEKSGEVTVKLRFRGGHDIPVHTHTANYAQKSRSRLTRDHQRAATFRTAKNSGPTVKPISKSVIVSALEVDNVLRETPTMKIDHVSVDTSTPVEDHLSQEEEIRRNTPENQPTNQVSTEEAQTPVANCISPNIPSPVANHVSRGPVTRSLAKKHSITPIEHPRNINKSSTDNDSTSFISDVMTVSTNTMSVDPEEDCLVDSVSDTSSTHSIIESTIDLDRSQPASSSDVYENASHDIDVLVREFRSIRADLQSLNISD